jgi:hypothetical protein
MVMAKTLRLFLVTFFALSNFIGAVKVNMVFAQPIVEDESQPRLVWEKTFEDNILAVGVDGDLITQGKEDFDVSLKWLLLNERGFDQLSFLNKAMLSLEKGKMYPRFISDNGKFLCFVRYSKNWWKKKRGVHYSFLNWDGELIWEMDEMEGVPLLWNDGSSVFLSSTRSHEKNYIGYVRFFNSIGEEINKYRYPEARKAFGIFYCDRSENFFVVGTIVPKQGFEVHVFEKNGNLLWKETGINRWFKDEQGNKLTYIFGGVTVSERGEVLLLLSRIQPMSYKALIFDKTGGLRDSLSFSPAGILNLIKTEDNLGFVSTGGYYLDDHYEGSYLMCYDFKNFKPKFILNEIDKHFGFFDVDGEAELIAVGIHQKDGEGIIKIFDLSGNYKTEVVANIGKRDKFWFKLMDNSLLVAEKNKLKLYTIDGR